MGSDLHVQLNSALTFLNFAWLTLNPFLKYRDFQFLVTTMSLHRDLLGTAIGSFMLWKHCLSRDNCIERRQLLQMGVLVHESQTLSPSLRS
jgi:hypothetical protein